MALVVAILVDVLLGVMLVVVALATWTNIVVLVEVTRRTTTHSRATSEHFFICVAWVLIVSFCLTFFLVSSCGSLWVSLFGGHVARGHVLVVDDFFVAATILALLLLIVSRRSIVLLVGSNFFVNCLLLVSRRLTVAFLLLF